VGAVTALWLLWAGRAQCGLASVLLRLRACCCCRAGHCEVCSASVMIGRGPWRRWRCLCGLLVRRFGAGSIDGKTSSTVRFNFANRCIRTESGKVGGFMATAEGLPRASRRCRQKRAQDRCSSDWSPPPFMGVASNRPRLQPSRRRSGFMVAVVGLGSPIRRRFFAFVPNLPHLDRL